MPQPSKGENHDDWMSRCMGDSRSVEKFPDQAQRAAVCYSKWEQAKNTVVNKVSYARMLQAMEQRSNFEPQNEAEEDLKNEIIKLMNKWAEF